MKKEFENEAFEEIGSFTIVEALRALETLIETNREVCGEYSKEVIYLFKTLGGLQMVVDELINEYFTYKTSSMIPSDLSFKDYLCIRGDGECQD